LTVKDTTMWHSRFWFYNLEPLDWGKTRPCWFSRVLPVTCLPDVDSGNRTKSGTISVWGNHVKPISAYTLGEAQFRMKSLVDSLFSLLPHINVKLDTKTFTQARHRIYTNDFIMT